MLRLDGGAQHERTVRPALPLQDTATLLKLIQHDLETHPPSGGIVGLELHTQSAAPYRAQHGLFLPQAPEPGQLEVMLARMRKLLGEQRVGSPELTDDHRPNAFRMVPFEPPSPGRNERQSLSTPIALRVSRPPHMVSVALANQVPVRVFWDGTAYAVRDAAGPVRVSGQCCSEANCVAKSGMPIGWLPLDLNDSKQLEATMVRMVCDLHNDGGLSLVRECLCGQWFMARTDNQECCSTACRQKKWGKTAQGKAAGKKASKASYDRDRLKDTKDALKKWKAMPKRDRPHDDWMKWVSKQANVRRAFLTAAVDTGDIHPPA